MDKSRQKTIMLGLVGVLLVGMLGAAVLVSVKILTRPGPKQIEEARKLAQLEAKGIDLKTLEDREKRNLEIRETLATLPFFKEPADGIIPPDRMEAYAMLNQAMVKALAEAKSKIPKGRKRLSQGLLIAQKLFLATNGAKYDNMAKYKINEKEHNWIMAKVNMGILAALVKLREKIIDPAQIELINKHIAYMAVVCGFYVPDARGEFIPKLDDFDPESVPKQDYRYVLQYYKELSFLQVQLDAHDWTPLLEEEGMPVDRSPQFDNLTR